MTYYEVIDLRTKQVKVICKSLRTARLLADQLDLKYGCINYGVRVVLA
jgi:hypothetical protein